MEKEIKFTEKTVVPKVLSANDEFAGMKLLNVNAQCNSHIDGFMGTIVFLTIDLESSDKK